MKTTIQSYKYACATCEKRYSRKSSLEKHQVLCNFVHTDSNEKQIIREEMSDIPSYAQLIQIVQQLSIKQQSLEQKMQDMQKWIDKKKKKINVMDWLPTPSNETTFTNFMKQIVVTETHLECLQENDAIKTISTIFEDTIPSPHSNEVVFPIQCFSQKTNYFYIFEQNNDGNTEWRLMTSEDYGLLMQLIQKKMLEKLINWKQENETLIKQNDTMCILYNKSIIKIMNIRCKQESFSIKFRSTLYMYLKKDLKNIIEYDFDF